MRLPSMIVTGVCYAPQACCEAGVVVSRHDDVTCMGMSTRLTCKTAMQFEVLSVTSDDPHPHRFPLSVIQNNSYAYALLQRVSVECQNEQGTHTCCMSTRTTLQTASRTCGYGVHNPCSWVLTCGQRLCPVFVLPVLCDLSPVPCWPLPLSFD